VLCLEYLQDNELTYFECFATKSAIFVLFIEQLVYLTLPKARFALTAMMRWASEVPLFFLSGNANPLLQTLLTQPALSENRNFSTSSSHL
jgi:hypothetical protein